MKNKKAIIGLIMICILGIIGGTIAFFSTTDVFDNLFGIETYKMEVYEIFESPSNWRPGDTTPKEIVATNKGDVDAAVRISFEEEWKDTDNNPVSLTDSNNVKAALIDLSGDFTRTWIKSIEDGKTYYYYRSKLAKEESTTNLVESVTFNPNVEITQNTNCVENSNDNSKNCSSKLSGYSNGHYKLTVKVETVQYNKYRDAWDTNVNIDNRRIDNLAEFVDSLIVTDSVANDDPEGNVRYIGAKPNNYVLYNNEEWRIIGEFGGRIKLMRSERLNSRFSWDITERDPETNIAINNGYGINEWSQADLMYELNGDYLNYNLTENPKWYYYGTSYPADFDIRQTLKQDAQDLIDDAVWHLGTSDHGINYWTNDYNAINIFNNERAGLHTYVDGERNYSARSNDDTVERSATWTGKVGLMYPSDYLYATSGGPNMTREQCLNDYASSNNWHNNELGADCGMNQWIKHGNDREWTISPMEYVLARSGVTRINSGGVSGYNADSDHEVRPVVFLRSNVIITGGTGSQENPFTIGL